MIYQIKDRKLVGILADTHLGKFLSPPEEIKAILEQVIPSEVIDKKAARESAWAKIDEARKHHQGQTFSDSVELLREDRNR